MYLIREIEDPGEDYPWLRPAPDSIPIDMKPTSDKAVFAEMANAEFTKYLQSHLGGNCPSRYGKRTRVLPTRETLPVFQTFLRDFRARGHKYATVFSRWVSLAQYKNGSQIGVEVVLYRHGKSHGKHVVMEVWVGKSGDVAYLSLKVLGVVPENDIRMNLHAPSVQSGVSFSPWSSAS